MSNYKLSELLNVDILQRMADAHCRTTGMPVGIIDAIDNSILVGSGWQEICVKYHRMNQEAENRCRESDNFIKDHLSEDQPCRYKCKNGLWDIGLPIVVKDKHLATLFLGQFFFDDEMPSREFFIRQAREFGFVVEDYLKALDRVPHFSKAKVESILEYNRTLVSFISDLAEQSLEKLEAEKNIHKSERKFRAIFDQAFQFIALLGIDGKVLKVNRTFLNFYEVKEVEVVGKPFWESPWWSHVPEFQEKLRHAAKRAAEGELTRFEVPHFSMDGSVRSIDFSLKPITDEAGKVVLLIHEGRDITDRKRAEEARVKAQKLESVGVLAGGIAHDFNNFLMTILGNVLLAKTTLSADHKAYDYLSNAETALQRAKGLTQQLLTFSRGGIPIKKTLSLGELVQTYARLPLSGSQCTCDFVISKDLWNVNADEGQISQVMSNLMLNAIQAMPAGGKITVICENCVVDDAKGMPLKGGDYVKVVVKDQGIGIPEKSLDKIFEPYFTTKDRGQGLGLASVYSILKNHEGHITVESKVGAGTSFSFYLPASDAPVWRAVPVEKEVRSGKEKVLLMDDEASIREVAGDMLQHLGYEVVLAKDGDEAISRYMNALEEKKPFDVVIMDLTIRGGMGGGEVIKTLVAIDPEVRALASSGYSNNPIMSHYGDYGFSGVVVKPYTMSELSEQIRHSLTRHQKVGTTFSGSPASDGARTERSQSELLPR